MQVVDLPRAKMLTLRLAEMNDAALLRKWRNDPVTRAMSRQQGEVAVEEHERWLAASLATRSRRTYIAILHGVWPVGTGRIDYSSYEAEISLMVAPKFRGQGHARRIIEALCEEIKDRKLPAVAEVLSSNTPSLLAFLHCGFEPTAMREERTGSEDTRRWLWMRRPADG